MLESLIIAHYIICTLYSELRTLTEFNLYHFVAQEKR